ncbi:uncharacterized protein FPRO_07447 [Fusarium proliferatum ET1]|uniref:Related to beta transducin-like protein n=1 Tax=Fusarium proliferatum (strain ET1) TaxID=1227346 RepID=A0A1L7VU72_FUSPR|nr:uncharacterized protein FPRO_07447 [Fusarium proliferatum ET1]CZR43636.1 related to beta transducin-like protein [Fusarium proliferatum ET1]
MRLINTKTLELHEFFSESTPPYAILSHAWGDQEVSFQDWQNRQQVTQKHGYTKILKACNEALKHKLEWLWVDTNCIDKSSSAELSEAINSMFEYYEKSEICFAYLADVPTASQAEDTLNSQIEKSRWFTRGWTLQELLAPKHLMFYTADWSAIYKDHFTLVSIITKIDYEFLSGEVSLQEASVAERMSWLAKRTTTRTEDMAYCMLGIFGINMPLLYGEGKRAFVRLQEEIIKTSNDHTIFCWGWNEDVPRNWASFLAPWPITFEGAGAFEILESDDVSVFSMSNGGLSIRLPVLPETAPNSTTIDLWLVKLQATSRRFPYPTKPACIRVVGRRVGELLYVARFPYPPRPVSISTFPILAPKRPLLVMNKLSNTRLYGNQYQPDFRYQPLKFTIVEQPGDFRTAWHCVALDGCNCESERKGNTFRLRLHSKGVWWAAVIVGTMESLPQTRICILLGGTSLHGSRGISVGLVKARGDGPHIGQKDENDAILHQWSQQLQLNDQIALPAAFESLLGISITLHESRGGLEADTRVLCLYKDQFGRSV